MANDTSSWEAFEESIFEVLNNAFQRQECAARAAARLERVVVDRYMAEQAKPITTAEEADEEQEEVRSVSQASREFSSDQFLTLFSNANLLRLVRELLDAMELHELEEEITTMIIRDSFKTRAGTSVGRHSGEGEQFIGTDEDLAFHNMREAAARAQRSR